MCVNSTRSESRGRRERHGDVVGLPGPAERGPAGPGSRVRRRPPAVFGDDTNLVDVIRNFRRQALHARRLAFNHPRSREPVSFEAPLPEDLQQLLEALIAHD